jgi:hypothetical protein
VLTQPNQIQSIRTLRLERRAIENGWNIDPKMRKAVRNDLLKVLANSNKERNKLAAARALLAACETIVRLGKSRYHDLRIDRMVEAAIAKAKGQE